MISNEVKKQQGENEDQIPCCYDFKWSEMTAREDRILVALISVTTPCGGKIGPPLLQGTLFIKIS